MLVKAVVIRPLSAVKVTSPGSVVSKTAHAEFVKTFHFKKFADIRITEENFIFFLHYEA